MTEHLSLEQHSAHVDVIASLWHDQDFQKDLRDLNAILAAHSGNAEDADEAICSEALDAFNGKYFGPYWLERPATISFYDNSGPDYTNISTICGKFIGIIPERYQDNQIIDRDSVTYVDDYFERKPAILIETESAYCTAPLDGNLLQFDVTVPPLPEDASKPLGLLKNFSTILRHLIATQTFQDLDPETRQAQLQELLEQITSTPSIEAFLNNRLALFTPDGIYTVAPSKLGCPQNITPDTAPLWLEYTLDGSEDAYAIAVDDIQYIDIIAAETETSVDLLDTFFADKHIAKYIQSVEDTINHAAPNERDDLLKRYREEIHSLIEHSDQFFNSTYEIEGMVYWAQDDDTIHGDYGAVVDASAIALDIKQIDGTWRVMIAFEGLATNDTVEADGFYIVPDRGHTSILRGVYDPNLQTEYFDITSYLTGQADIARRYVDSEEFQGARYSDQAKELNNLADDVEDELCDRFDIETGEAVISCLTSRYFPIFADEVDATCQQIAERAPTTTNELPEELRRPILGIFRGVTIPEVTINPQKHEFRTKSDFPLSGGEPMLVLENEELGIAYFIPIREVTYLNDASIPEF